MIEVFFSIIIMGGEELILHESELPMSSYERCIEAGELAVSLYDNVIGYQCNVFVVKHEKETH